MGRYDILLERDNKPDKTQPKPASWTRDKNSEVDKPEDVRAEPVLPVPPVRPVLPLRGQQRVKRLMKTRHPFDIYHDQYDSLKELALQDRMQGGEGSMSAMVRQALDDFISKQKRR